MRLFIAVVVIAAVLGALTVDRTFWLSVPPADAASCVTSAEQHQLTLAHLDKLAHSGYTLSRYAKLVQAGVAAKHRGIVWGHLMAYKTRTLASAPPVNEDPGGGGYYAETAPGYWLSGVYFPHGLKIWMGCPGGGSAWTGGPPGELQAGIAVHFDSAISNEAFAYCPATAYGNCLFDWEASDVGGLAFFWITGKNTYPMWIPGWTVCR